MFSRYNFCSRRIWIAFYIAQSAIAVGLDEGEDADGDDDEDVDDEEDAEDGK